MRHRVTEVGRTQGARVGSTGESAQASEPADESGLPERDKRILDFERHWRNQAGAKDGSIRAQFGLTSARYYQLLNTVIDTPAATVYDPMLVRRLQRLRDTKVTARTMRRLNSPGN